MCLAVSSEQQSVSKRAQQAEKKALRLSLDSQLKETRSKAKHNNQTRRATFARVHCPVLPCIC